MTDAAAEATRAYKALRESFRRGAQEKVVHKRIELFQAAVLKQVREAPPRLVAALHKKLTLQVLNGVTNKTPVDTGRARNGWQVGVDAIPTGDRGEPSDFAGNAIRDDVMNAGAAALKGLKPYGKTFVANAVHYVPHLEYGTSEQAPVGMVVRTVNEVASKIHD